MTGSRDDRLDSPLTRHAFEYPRSPIFELDTGSNHEIFDR